MLSNMIKLFIQRMLIVVSGLSVTTISLAQTTAAVDAPGVAVDTRSQLFEAPKTQQLDRIRDRTQPFGHTLFGGGFSSSETLGLNADYVVGIGDRIAVRVWGATSYDDVQEVDTQGNIFIPDVGPVRLGGVKNSNINSTVKSAVARVYTCLLYTSPSPRD